MDTELPVLDFNDTFLDLKHIEDSFPDYKVKVAASKDVAIERPFRYIR